MHYTPKPEDLARIDNNHKHHAPHDASQTQRYEGIRRMTRDVAEYLLTVCPPSRELSVALTKLEETMFWSNAAIARNEKPQ